MSVNSATVRRELGAGLKALRGTAGLTVRALAERTKLSAANISNYENASRLLPEERLVTILDALSASSDERERLLGLRRQAEEAPGELVGGATTIGARLARLIEQEQTARRITEVAPLLVPGLLQTRGYARAVLAAEQNVDTLVTLRMGRQAILSGPDAVHLHALIDDEVLVRPVAPKAVMADQLRHLLAMAERPNITIQLVPSTEPGYSPHLAGPYILLAFATADPIVHVEHYSASATIWEHEDVRRFMAAVEEIKRRAMTPERTTEVITHVVHGMET